MVTWLSHQTGSPDSCNALDSIAFNSDGMNTEIRDHKKLVNLYCMTRDSVIPFYASLIISGDDNETQRINQLILSKWKPSGLIYIKEKAWKTEYKNMSLFEAWKKDFI